MMLTEDCKGYTIADIEKEFGKDVANYVLNVTEVDKSLSWKQRKRCIWTYKVCWWVFKSIMCSR